MPGKTPDEWEIAERFAGHLIYVREDPRTKRWRYGLVPMPRAGHALYTAHPSEDAGGEFTSKDEALHAATTEVIRRNQQRKGGKQT